MQSEASSERRFAAHFVASILFRRDARVFAAVLIALTVQVVSADARIKRSTSGIVEFKQSHPCPVNGATKEPCKGYVIEHIKALVSGGADAPLTMQWQTIADAKAKDKWERKECEK